MGVQVGLQLRNLVHRRTQQRPFLRNAGGPCCPPPPIALQFRHNSQGERTIFRIRVLSGVDISALSSVPGGPCPSSHSAFSAHACDFAEKEILLLPCCCFDILKASPSPFIPESSCCGVTLLQVENLHAVAPGLLMIDLEEVDSPFSLSGL